MLPGSPPRRDNADGTASSPDDRVSDPLDLLWHDLKVQLTVIRGQAHLLRRRLVRLDGLDGTERAWLLERGARIDAAILAMADRIEQVGREGHERPPQEDAREPYSEQGR